MKEELPEPPSKPPLTPSDKAYYKGAGLTALTGLGLGGAALFILPVAPLFALGGGALATVAGAHLVGKWASNDKSVFNNLNVDQELSIIFGAATDISNMVIAFEAITGFKKNKPENNNTNSKIPLDRLQDHEYFLTFIQDIQFLDSQFVDLKSCFTHFKQHEERILYTQTVLKQAIDKGSAYKAFYGTWVFFQNLELVYFIYRLKTICPDQVPKTLTEAYIRKVHFSWDDVEKLLTNWSKIEKRIAPYKQAFLVGLYPSIELIANKLATSLMNLYWLEASGQSKQKPAINLEIDEIANSLTALSGNAFLEKEKVNFIIHSVLDPNYKIEVPCAVLQVKGELFKQLQHSLNIINSTLLQDEMAGMTQMIKTSSIKRQDSTIVSRRAVETVYLPELLAPLFSQSMRQRMARFLSKESNNAKIDVIKIALSNIIKLSLISEKPIIASHLKDIAAVAQIAAMGNTAGLEMAGRVDREINLYGQLQYGVNNITSGFIKSSVSLVSGVVGYFVSWGPSRDAKPESQTLTASDSIINSPSNSSSSTVFSSSEYKA